MLASSEIDGFLEYLQKNRKYSPLTIKTYKDVLEEAAPFVEEEREAEKRVFDITPYRLHIKTNAKKNIAKKISALNSFFEYLRTVGENVKSIGAGQIKVPKTLPKPLHKEAIQSILDSCKNSEEKLIVTMLYGLGLRISELYSLKIENISKEWVTVREAKGGKDRTIPIHPELGALLEEYISEHGGRVYLFEKEQKPLRDYTLRYKLDKIFKRAGVEATPHKLRHSFATDMINEGARIVDVSEMLGHKELSTTQIYTKLSMKKKMQSYLESHPMCKE